MVVIKIYTKKFAAQLIEWARSLNIFYETVQNGEDYYCIAETENLNELANFFTQLAAINNAALKNQAALRDAVIKGMSSYKNIISAQLAEYFENSSHMSLEGFLHFRLWEYSYKIDLLLYAYMKKELKLYGYI
ncbi:MAG: putative sporulation protein YtxC [Clostridiales bacterium]|nr:putative sporulation protein YtxC [Clostridiales bacterium]